MNKVTINQYVTLLSLLIEIKELVKNYPNDMELGSKVRELFEKAKVDTMGYPIEKISKYLTADIDEAVMDDK